jgi:hypothetical protein
MNESIKNLIQEFQNESDRLVQYRKDDAAFMTSSTFNKDTTVEGNTVRAFLQSKYKDTYTISNRRTAFLKSAMDALSALISDGYPTLPLRVISTLSSLEGELESIVEYYDATVTNLRGAFIVGDPVRQ